MKNSDLKALFFQGNYRQVLALSIELDGGVSGLREADFIWVMGALCFTGRKEEADALYLEFKLKSGSLAEAACRFFLGVAFCRHGHYPKALRFFTDNLREHYKAEGQLGFYAWQGLAYYRYFCADFKRSERAALRALARATFASFTYGRTLAFDIIGHSLTQQGQVSAGLQRLGDAKKSAESMGNGGLMNSIEISSLVYRAQFGIKPKTVLRELKSARANLDPQNSYAQANLLLEMSNQSLLRGSIQDATANLNEASTLIYGSQHRRYAHLLALRFAELSYRRGEFASALYAVQMQRANLDEKYDRVNLLMALGIEIKLLKALKMESQVPPLQALLQKLTGQTSRSISKNLHARLLGNAHAHSEDDPIDKLFASLSEPDAIGRVLDSGYLSFVYEALKLTPGSSWIVAGQNGVIILEKGEVTSNQNLKARLPDQLLRLLGALASGIKRKEDLIREVWGYAYHPLQHDPLLYQAMTRLREVLGRDNQLIIVSEDGYHLRNGFGFILLKEKGEEIQSIVPHRLSNSKPPKTTLNEVFSHGLNERQIKILELLNHQQFLGVRECLKKFKVTSMTLKRDFAGLIREGWVVRVGHARATRYVLKNKVESDTVTQ